MKILITGGAGFIGSYLIRKLLEDEENQIFAIDNFSTGQLNNLWDIKDKLKLYTQTILWEPLMDKLISEVDQVYHLAACVGVKKIMESPVETLETNVKGTEIVLKFADKYKKKVLIVSTSEVYGKSFNFTEDSDRILGSVKKRRWAYSCSKAFDEFLALAYHEEKGLEVVITRLFNTVGPGQLSDYGMVLPRFVESAKANLPITVYGDGWQTRSFCHVKDTVEGMVGLMNEPKAIGDIFNVGNPEEITIKDLAKKVKKMALSRSEIVCKPYGEVYGEGFEDMMRREPDIAKIQNLIGWGPNYDIDSIIKDMVGDKYE